MSAVLPAARRDASRSSSLDLLRGVLALVAMAVNTVACAIPLLSVALVKLVLPFPAVRRRVDPVLAAIGTLWIDGNGVVLGLVQRGRTTWEVEGVAGLRPEGWLLVTSNHRSWVDILVLQRVLAHRLPMLKFFLKHTLRWVPVLGLAWWALDFPFLHRHGAAALERNPGLRHQDRASSRRACERFRLVSTSVMVFPEGSRHTRDKHAAQASPYRHLLVPRSGALAVALDAMGPQLRGLVDVTIAYPGGTPSLWDFVRGRCPRVVVRVAEASLPAELLAGPAGAGAAPGTDPTEAQERAWRASVQRWVDALWQRKDETLDELCGS